VARLDAFVREVFVTEGTVVTPGQRLLTPDVADAVDMESTTILGESRNRGVPSIAIRAISDPVNVDLPLDRNRLLTAQGGVSLVRAIGALARRPHAVPGLVRLSVEGRRAAVALSEFLDAYVEHAACRHHQS
jgi:adenosylhomocysteine nucleosidase